MIIQTRVVGESLGVVLEENQKGCRRRDFEDSGGGQRSQVRKIN